MMKRPTFVFFKDQLAEEDFWYISKTENTDVQTKATTTVYRGHTEPLNVIPFIWEYWNQFGRPPRVGSAKKKDLNPEEQRYNDFHSLLHSVLERPSDAGADLDE